MKFHKVALALGVTSVVGLDLNGNFEHVSDQLIDTSRVDGVATLDVINNDEQQLSPSS